VHDLDGNITRKYGASTDIRYAWSASGQLMGDTVASTGATIGYDYNALGQLVRRTKNETPDRYYLWDGMQPVAELDSSASNRIAGYAYLPGGSGQPFAIVLGAKAVSAIRDVELDAMGNAIGVLTSAGGVIERRTYDLWGAISSDSGALGDSAFVGWKGLLWEGDSTRLYYAQNRWYDPNTGRFVSEDPIGIAGGLNAYVFVGDDPVNGSDPSGLFGGCGGPAGPCFPGHGLGTPLGCLTRYPCIRESGKYLPGVYLSDTVSCRATTFPGTHGTIHVQTNSAGYVSWGIYMDNPLYNYGPWSVDVFVNGRRVDGKVQSYPPHGSINPTHAPPGSVVSFSATHEDFLGRPYRSVPNACIVPQAGK